MHLTVKLTQKLNHTSACLQACSLEDWPLLTSHLTGFEGGKPQGLSMLYRALLLMRAQYPGQAVDLPPGVEERCRLACLEEKSLDLSSLFQQDLFRAVVGVCGGGCVHKAHPVLGGSTTLDIAVPSRMLAIEAGEEPRCTHVQCSAWYECVLTHLCATCRWAPALHPGHHASTWHDLGSQQPAGEPWLAGGASALHHLGASCSS